MAKWQAAGGRHRWQAWRQAVARRREAARGKGMQAACNRCGGRQVGGIPRREGGGRRKSAAARQQAVVRWQVAVQVIAVHPGRWQAVVGRQAGSGST